MRQRIEAGDKAQGGDNSGCRPKTEFSLRRSEFIFEEIYHILTI